MPPALRAPLLGRLAGPPWCGQPTAPPAAATPRAGLRKLCLVGAHFDELPPVLAGATNLVDLEFRRCDFILDRAGEDLILSLPCLDTVVMDLDNLSSHDTYHRMEEAKPNLEFIVHEFNASEQDDEYWLEDMWVMM